MGRVLLRNKLYTKGTVASSGGGGSGTVETIIPGTNITIDNTDPANPIVSTTADDITVVANYAALPAANTVSGEFYWCSASQGTSWLPGGLGGTYYSAGLYYSNGTTWEYLATPYQATQAEVNTGSNTDKFVTPSTLNNYNGWTATKVGLSNVENTALSTWTGSTNITTLGTIATGTIPAARVSAGTFRTGAYVMDTSLTNPILIGGTGTTSTLTFRPTSGNSTTGADFIWATGNNGGTERMRMLNAGSLLIGGTSLVNTNELLSVQGSVNGNVNYAIRNGTAGTAARASTAIMSGSLGLYMNALSTSYTTSGINVTGKATILTDMLGLNIGTTSAQSLQFWTNNTQKAFIPSTGGLIIGTAALATNATAGFLYIPTCAGTPTGVPTAQTGTAPIVWDSTNKKLYVYDGSWLGGTTPGIFI